MMDRAYLDQQEAEARAKRDHDDSQNGRDIDAGSSEDEFTGSLLTSREREVSTLLEELEEINQRSMTLNLKVNLVLKWK